MFPLIAAVLPQVAQGVLGAVADAVKGHEEKPKLEDQQIAGTRPEEAVTDPDDSDKKNITY
ncbi:hypothetical protein [Pseudomonas rossensis]|uniref:hypothetical protein n=1 Tax=Pseudomonas rossensis TaxID=2305471 RepID=UPI003261205F